jgi:hypothetical protein
MSTSQYLTKKYSWLLVYICVCAFMVKILSQFDSYLFLVAIRGGVLPNNPKP